MQVARIFVLRIFAQLRSSTLTNECFLDFREGHMKRKVRIYVHVCMFVSRSKFRIIKFYRRFSTMKTQIVELFLEIHDLKCLSRV
jgi:hypothetical protein